MPKKIKRLSYNMYNDFKEIKDNKFNEYDYNNIYFSPTEITNFKVVYPIIKEITSFNNHTVERRQLINKHNQTKDYYVNVTPKPILLHINLNDVIKIVDALPLMDTILLSNVPIMTIIDGVCRDSLILPFLVGKKRYMYKHSHIYLTTFFYEQSSGSTIEDKMTNITTFRNKIISIFKKYTKFPDSIYKTLFKRELFLDADDCLKYGIIDYII